MPEPLRAGKVVYRAAFFDRFAAGDAVVHHAGQERQRAALGVRAVDRVVGVDHQPDEVIHLGFVGAVEFVKGVQLLGFARLGADLRAVGVAGRCGTRIPPGGTY